MKTKLINKILLGTSLLPIMPIVALTSCSNDQKTITSTVLCNEDYFETIPVIPTIKENNAFTFTFKLKDKCFVNQRKSYVLSILGGEHAFNGRYISCTSQGNTYTVNVSKDLAVSEKIVIYISVYKELNIDTSACPTTDFDFDTVLFPNPVEKERYTFGFKILNNKGLDVNNSKIYIGGTELTRDKYSLYESEIDSTIYTFISISSTYMLADIKLDFKAADYVPVSYTSYPEYSLTYTSAPVINNDFVCYLTPNGYSSFKFGTPVVTAGGTALVKDTDYVFDDSLTIPTLTIKASVLTDTSKNIVIDVPTIETFTCYACKEYENPTVEVDGDDIVKGQVYMFKVWGLNDKDILWDNANTYIEIGDQKITKDNGFTVTKDDPQKLIYTVTVEATYAVGDMYCHFIAK